MGKVRDIVDILSEKYEINEWWDKYSAFQTLVSIILSQKTYWKNVRAATERFGRQFGSIEDVAGASAEKIEETIKPAGLHHARASRILNIARELVERYDSKLEQIVDLPYEEAKKKLTSLKGVGPKTADVFLMTVKGEQVLPVDVHISRIMGRLGIADEDDDYESLRAKLETEIPPNERTKAHLVLIEFGRQMCRSQNPKCEECPIKKYCEVKNR